MYADSNQLSHCLLLFNAVAVRLLLMHRHTDKFNGGSVDGWCNAGQLTTSCDQHQHKKKQLLTYLQSRHRRIFIIRQNIACLPKRLIRRAKEVSKITQYQPARQPARQQRNTYKKIASRSNNQTLIFNCEHSLRAGDANNGITADNATRKIEDSTVIPFMAQERSTSHWSPWCWSSTVDRKATRWFFYANDEAIMAWWLLTTKSALTFCTCANDQFFCNAQALLLKGKRLFKFLNTCET